MKVLAEFESAGRATHALTALTALGYLDLETYAPFPLTDEQAHAPRGSFPLAFLAFGGGLTGLAVAYVIQWWANVESYPLNIGGRPAHAAAAFVPASFETVCLLATLGVFAGFLLLERLPRLWQPVFEIEGFERANVDRFWIALTIADTPTQVEQVRHDIVPLNPLRIVVSEDIT
jgi:hypothetical protein